jgi:uncharacterized protein YndB with AHSA1/START domain
MPEKQFRIEIQVPPEAVFDLIADLAHYDRWLPGSNLYKSTMSISDDPVRKGTTYTDSGTSSKMKGEVSEFDPPKRLTFTQTSRSTLGTLSIRIRYSLTPVKTGGAVSTAVIRDYKLDISGLLKLAQPILVRTINRENERILQTMRDYLEAQAR